MQYLVDNWPISKGPPKQMTLLEGAGRDLCCVISSLVQLLLDSHFRTITGFQSLLQKEWVAGGHPFCDRLGHIVKTNSEKVGIVHVYKRFISYKSLIKSLSIEIIFIVFVHSPHCFYCISTVFGNCANNIRPNSNLRKPT